MNKALCIGAMVAGLAGSYVVSNWKGNSEAPKEELVARFNFDPDAARYFKEGVQRMKREGVTYARWQMYTMLHDADENDDLYLSAGEAKDLCDKVLNPESPLAEHARSHHALYPESYEKLRAEVGEKWTRTMFVLQYEDAPILMLTESEKRAEAYQKR